MNGPDGDRRPAFKPTMAVVAALLLLLAGMLAAAYQRHSAVAEHRSRLVVQAKILAASVTAAITFNDHKTAQEYVNALKLDPRLDAVVVYDDEHHPVAGFLRPDAPPVGAEAGSHSGLLDERLVVTAPARQGGTTVGSVYLRQAQTPLSIQVARYSGVALLTIMAVLVLTVLALAQRVQQNANRALHERAAELAAANERLSAEMAQRERTEEALRQSQKMEAIGQLSGGIAHDFNNLLMVIKSSLSLLQEKLEQIPAAPAVADDSAREGAPGRAHAPTDPRQLARYVSMAQDSVDRARGLTRRLLTFARQQPLAPRRLDLDRLIRDMQPLLAQSVGPQFRITYRLGAQGQVYCDPSQMESTVLNLVINARDAMPDGGRIFLCSENLQLDATTVPDALPPGEYVHLQVVDEGMGMTEEVRRKAFDPFFTTKAVGKGTGLGLSTILGYVVQSRGSAWIESAPGHGTTVHILLPRAPHPPP